MHSCVFDKNIYPDYENKKVQTQKGGFPTYDAKVYVFRKVNDHRPMEAEENQKS